jgi:branched-chain amino acid transport system substrate-binding protein
MKPGGTAGSRQDQKKEECSVEERNSSQEDTMKIVYRLKILAVTAALSLCALGAAAQGAEPIVIGLNLPLSGALKDIGQHTKEGAELALEDINQDGGLLVGAHRHPVRFIYADNKSNIESAVAGALNMISRDMVLGIVGPCASSNAIPVGGIAESFKTPMVSPTSTNPKTTENRPFVFRACFLDNFQGEAMARFAIKEFKAEKAAVIYDIDNAYPKGLAEFFKTAFEAEKGAGSVTAFESFESDAGNLKESFARIVASGADVLFVPQYAHELPGILKQARDAGWQKPVLGGDAWEASDLMETCGDLCKGLYFSSHFGAVGAKGLAGEFVKRYQAKTGRMPTAFGALGYDTTKLMLQAVSRVDGLSGNLFADRAKIKEQIAAFKGFEGVSGVINMNESGDPAKSAVIIRISDKGEFESYATENP